MPLWESVAGLPFRVDGRSIGRRELETAAGWTRVTTTVDYEHVPGELPAGPASPQRPPPAPEGPGL